MALKDILAKAQVAVTRTVTRHRSKIDQGINKIGDVANTKTGGRYQDQIRKGSDQARAGLDKVSSDRPEPGTDGPLSTTPGPR